MDNQKAENTIATIKGYRRTGGAVVTVTRNMRARRYRVSLRRWHALRAWCNTGGPWMCHGAWLNNALDVAVGPQTWADWESGRQGG